MMKAITGAANDVTLEMQLLDDVPYEISMIWPLPALQPSQAFFGFLGTFRSLQRSLDRPSASLSPSVPTDTSLTRLKISSPLEFDEAVPDVSITDDDATPAIHWVEYVDHRRSEYCCDRRPGTSTPWLFFHKF